jgi:hypothetical protein
MRTSNKTLKALTVIPIMLLVLLQINALQAGAQSITGLSQLIISQNSSTIYMNSSLAIPFQLNLTTGKPGTTYMIIGNGAALQYNGVYASFNHSIITPTANDVLFINTNVNSQVLPGVYTIEIESGGADPINPGTFNFTLTVINAPKPTTTTISATNSTTPPSAVVQSEEQKIGIVFGIAIVVIIAILIVNKIRS